MFKAKKAQSTLEYIIIFSVIVVAVFVLAYQFMRPAMEEVINASGTEMENAGKRFTPFNWSVGKPN